MIEACSLVVQLAVLYPTIGSREEISFSAEMWFLESYLPEVEQPLQQVIV